MRHRKKSERFSRSRAQRKALKRSLLRALIIEEKIKTTQSKAKGIRTMIDKLISLGKRGDVHSRRLVYKWLGDHKLVKKLFDDIAPRFKDVSGGYTRIINLGHRQGDGALISIIELIRKKEESKPKKKAVAKEVKKEEAAPSKEETEPIKGKKGFVSTLRSFFKKKQH